MSVQLGGVDWDELRTRDREICARAYVPYSQPNAFGDAQSQQVRTGETDLVSATTAGDNA